MCRLRMMVGKTLGMIGKYLDHSAIGYLTAAALDDHAIELGLERFKPRDTAFDVLELPPCNLVGGCTRVVRIVG